MLISSRLAALAPLILAPLLAFACPLAVRAEMPYVLFSEDPWPPFTYGHEGEPPTGGIAVDIVRAIAERAGFTPDLMLYPWPRCLHQMQNGDRDGLMLCSKSAQREEYLVYTLPVLTVRNVLFLRQEHTFQGWETFKDLSGLTIIRAAGFWYGEEFERATRMHNIKTIEGPDDTQNFRMLAAGRVDALICNERVGREIIRTNKEFHGQFKMLDTAVNRIPMHLAFSRLSPASKRVPTINMIIQQLREEGTLERLANPHGTPTLQDSTGPQPIDQP